MISSLLYPKNQWIILAFSIFIFYSVIPYCVSFYSQGEEFEKLALLGFCSSVTLFLVSLIFINLKKNNIRTPVYNSLMIYGVLFLFLLHFLVTVATAPSVPLLDALRGGSRESMAIARESFLKDRSGVLSSLVYLNAILTSTFLPYILILSFNINSKVRWIILNIFFVFSLSFLSKVFFLKWAAPLAAYFLGKEGKTLIGKVKFMSVIIFSVVLISFNIIISKFGTLENLSISSDVNPSVYFSSSYSKHLQDGSAFDFFLWRLVSVPIFTASDSLVVFNDYYNNQYLYGSTNGTVASVFNIERIRFERILFSYQWRSGIDAGTKSSNAVYFIESYINFGYIGVLIFSVISSWLLVAFGYSSNVAVSCLAPLLTLGLFTGGLLGLLFGNGFLLFFFVYYIFSRKAQFAVNEIPR
ncbi:MAG: hypothetical protein ACI8ZB_000702 [Desulforhopalus sp.]